MRRMFGSVYSREKGLWDVSVELERDGDTGKRRRVTRRVRGSRKTAEERLNSLMAELGEAQPDGMTVQEFFNDYYIESARSRLREVTVNGYIKDWEHLVGDSIGRKKLQAVRPLDVERVLNGIDGDKKKFAAYKIMRQVFNRAKKLRLIASSPVDAVDAPKVRPYEPEVLNAAQARAYLEHFRGSDVEAAVVVAIGCGLRRSEIAALDWEDIGEDGSVRVDNGIVMVAGRAVDNDTKTVFSTRTVHLPPKLAVRMNELRESGPMLKDRNGNRMSPDVMHSRYRERQKTLPEGIPRITMKNLRHTSLTLALESGADLLAVSRRGGHSGPGITARYYLRPSEDLDRGTANGMDALL